jgi:hypothetical protein
MMETGAARFPGSRCLRPEGDVGQRVELEGLQVKRRRLRRRVELLADLLQFRGHRPRGEHAGDDDVPRGRTRLFNGGQGVKEVFAVVVHVRVVDLPAAQAAPKLGELRRHDRSTPGVLDTAGHHEHIAGVLVQHLVGGDVQGFRFDVPNDLVDADPVGPRPLGGQGAAQFLQEDRVAVHRRQVDLSGERNRDPRGDIEPVKGVDHADVGVIRGPRSRIR